MSVGRIYSPEHVRTERTVKVGAEVRSAVLVVGANGFVGRPAAACLRSRGLDVLETSRTGDGADLACDILLTDSIDRALTATKPKTILLTAGMASVSESWENPHGTYRINTEGTFNLLESSRRLAPDSQILVTSSAAVYGPAESVAAMPFREISPTRAASPYAASKAAAELLCHQYVRQTGLRVTICRLFNQIGPGQGATQAPAEFSRDIAEAERQGKDRVLLSVGDPETARDFTDVRDTARAIADLVEAESIGTFNICSGTAVSLARIVEILSALSPLEVETVTDPDRKRKADILASYGSGEKLREATGWQPEIPLEQSLGDLLEDWRGRV